MSKLSGAYDDAAAVFTSPVHFVEWKWYHAPNKHAPNWLPFGMSREQQWKEIEGERWIYVFRRQWQTPTQPAKWVDEIKRDADGGFWATPMADARVAPAKRPHQVAVKEVSFIRRAHGYAMAHFFFASRVRLPLRLIEELEKTIDTYVPPISFEPDDPHARKPDFVKPGGKRVVGKVRLPVLDPITVAMHLHHNYVAAADDLLQYSTDPQRQKKVLLAQVLQAVLASDESGRLGSKLKQQNGEIVDDFITSHQGQVKHRLFLRDMWASFLADWLGARPMKLLEEACLADIQSNWLKYFVPFCWCVTRMNEAPAGRAMLAGILRDEDHFAYTYIFPQEKPTGDAWQAFRKGGSAGLEALKEFLPEIVLIIEEPAKFIVKTIGPWDLLHRVKVTEYDWGFKFELSRENYEFTGTFQRIEFEPTKYEIEFEPAWEGAASKIGFIVEFINTALAAKEVLDAFEGRDANVKALALVKGIGALFDLGITVVALTKGSARLMGGLAFISGLIDALVATRELGKDLENDANWKVVGGDILVIQGSVLSAMGGFGLLLAIPGAGELIALGMALMAIGQAIKIVFGDDEDQYTKYVAHCAWGSHYGEGDETPKWSNKTYAQWKDDFDEQLQVLLNLICRVQVEPGGEPRDAKVTLTWLPPGAWLEVQYYENWESAKDSRKLNGFADLSNGKPVELMVGAQMKITSDGDDGVYRVWPVAKMTSKPLQVERKVSGIDEGHARSTTTELVRNPDLQSIELYARLLIKSVDTQLKVPPNDAFYSGFLI